MIYIEINKYSFANAFKSSNTYKDNFSNDALNIIFEHLESMSEDEGDIELDIVEISRDYAEYDLIESFINDYKDFYFMDDEYQDIKEVERWLQKRTNVLK